MKFFQLVELVEKLKAQKISSESEILIKSNSSQYLFNCENFRIETLFEIEEDEKLPHVEPGVYVKGYLPRNVYESDDCVVGKQVILICEFNNNNIWMYDSDNNDIPSIEECDFGEILQEMDKFAAQRGEIININLGNEPFSEKDFFITKKPINSEHFSNIYCHSENEEKNENDDNYDQDEDEEDFIEDKIVKNDGNEDEQNETSESIVENQHLEIIYEDFHEEKERKIKEYEDWGGMSTSEMIEMAEEGMLDEQYNSWLILAGREDLV